ncbi:MAG TPA: cytochrome c oxidase subunit II [Candidatus Limnocylindria bacterium]|nr:cytochrome c oxidase subunit II [Candidatus Limnocylindria bacterium]
MQRSRMRRTLVPVTIGLIGLLMVLTGCTPAPVTTEGRDVANLYRLFMAAAVVVFLVVAGLIGWSVVRYRSGVGGDPAQFQTNVPLEVVWWALPTLLVVGLFAVSAQVLATVDRSSDGGALTVDVEGFQWQWRFTYPDSGVTVTGHPDEPPEITLPVGREVTFVLTSPDVVHSFYVPEFLIKRDAVPGITNKVTLTIDSAGTYTGQCAEFCGLLHSDMRFSIRAVPSNEFDSWLQQQAQQQATP